MTDVTTTTPPLTALVTGATSGLGKAIALRLGRDGMRIIVVGHDKARGAAVVEQIETEGGQATFIAADLSDAADIGRLAVEAGEIDVLVNNAGFSLWAPTEEVAAEDFDAMFASNVRAPFLLVGKFAPAMAAKGAGSIINISSMAGRIGLPNGAAYGATRPRWHRSRKAGPRSTAPEVCGSTLWPPVPSTLVPKPANSSTASGRPPPCTGQPSRVRSPRSSPSSPPPKPAT